MLIRHHRILHQLRRRTSNEWGDVAVFTAATVMWLAWLVWAVEVMK